MASNEAMFLGVNRPPKKKPEKKPNKADERRDEIKNVHMLLAPAADKLIEILEIELKKNDSNTAILNRLRSSNPHPTDSDYAVEMRASEIVADRLRKVILLLESAKKASNP